MSVQQFNGSKLYRVNGCKRKTNVMAVKEKQMYMFSAWCILNDNAILWENLASHNFILGSQPLLKMGVIPLPLHQICHFVFSHFVYSCIKSRLIESTKRKMHVVM